MKKSFVFICAAALGVTTASAQLSTRENESSVDKLGARPVAGDMALTFSMNFQSLLDSANADGSASLYLGNFFKKGDFLTFKYYKADDLAIRAAIKLSRSGFKSSGDIADSIATAGAQTGNSTTRPIEVKSSNREYFLVPGIEKHFSTSNIFDVYAGADLFIGFSKKDSINNMKAINGDFSEFRRKSSSMVLGLGGVVGFNLFIAHLPISIGLEYGWNLKMDMGGKSKVTAKTQTGTVATSAEYYVSRDGAATGATGLYKKLGETQMNMDTNQDVRLTLNIYFGK